MEVINILAREVSELIAAGEVIERPVSVVKEIIENSIDAGSTQITIEINNGGVKYIKIVDNGIGIYKKDIKKAFLRYATSKVKEISDLDNIMTLGFRGEALASISSVAKVELITKTREDLDATRYIIEGGEEKLIEETGAAVGTTIIVRDLFFNVPARMKFLKTDTAEGNAIETMIDRLALSHPEIAFRFIREGKEKLSTFGDGNLKSAIYCVFGKQFYSMMLPLKYEENNVVISGYISNPSESKASRANQIFFINSRYIRSKICYAALEEAYTSFIVQGRFPSCVIKIEIPSALIDINVHPAKLEVRFANEKMIYNIIYSAVKNSILTYCHNPIMELEKQKGSISKEVLNSNETRLDMGSKIKENNGNGSVLASQSVSKDLREIESKLSIKGAEPHSFHENGLSKNHLRNVGNREKGYKKIKDIRMSERNQGIEINEYNKIINEITNSYERIKEIENKGDKIGNFIKSDVISEKESEIEGGNGSELIEIDDKIGAKDKNDSEDKELVYEQELIEIPKKEKIIGEIFNSYIILERQDGLILIDKHAAHERIIYEKIKRGEYKTYKQMLLKPIIMELSLMEYQAAIDNVSIFENMGFTVEDFGSKTIIIREIPMIISEKGGRQFICDVVMELIGNIINHKNNISSRNIDKIYFTFACKAAIKAGDKNDILELEKITDLLRENRDLKNCPHGRPVYFMIKKRDIDKQFLR